MKFDITIYTEKVDIAKSNLTSEEVRRLLSESGFSNKRAKDLVSCAVKNPPLVYAKVYLNDESYEYATMKKAADKEVRLNDGGWVCHESDLDYEVVYDTPESHGHL